MNPLLRITNLTIRKGAKILLHLPSLDIFKGAIYGIIGESGSGKSLTLLAAMGLLPNEINAQGLVEWNGLNLLEFSQSQWMAIRNKQIGMVFQEPMTALNPQMTCGEQLIESVLVHSKPTKPELKKILSEALLEVGLTDVDRFLGSYPHQISGGQRQRIMIAMATIHKPLLVLADEPTTALDPETGKAVMDVLVQRCKKTGSALLLVSHDLHLIREIAEYVSVFRKGECLAQGNVSDVFSLHPHSYVSELINASPSGGRDDIKETVEKLEVKDIVKSYRTGKKELKVLQHISFTLNKGETLAILGGSGTGKSTIAKILTGLEKADGGQIIFNGNNIGNRKNTGIQMVFQDPFASLNQNLTNLEAVAEVLRVKGQDKVSAKTKAMDLILSVGLTEDQMLAYPQNLSGGQRQRLCIARALASSPDVLILDEAVAALDPLVQKQVLDLLKEIQTKTNIIYIFITHNLEVAASFAHQTIRLNMAAVVH